MAALISSRRIGRGAITANCAILLACVLVAHASLPTRQQQASSPPTSAKPSTSTSTPNSDSGAVNSNDAERAFYEAASASIAPVVYPDDETPAARGYHYTFFGNAFFINEDGYLLTVAHVLETFRDGGEPSILVSRANAPPGLVHVTVVARDEQHDLAILRAVPNPLASNHSISFVPLSSGEPARGESVLALSLHPRQIQNAHTFELPREDSSPGTVIALESTQLAKAGPLSDVFLLSHAVVKGQSGSPVMDLQTHAVIGLVEGIWLRGDSSSVRKTSTDGGAAPGAAIPIAYAVALLKQNGVSWHAAAPLSSGPRFKSVGTATARRP